MLNYCFKILKRPAKYILLGICMVYICSSCDSIEAQDISNETVSIILPSEGQVIAENSVNFNWTSVEFADEYHIQIARPDFTTPLEFVIDSLITTNSANFVLEPNQYQWRVRAENNISQTEYTTPISFQVDEVIDLTDQTVSLSSPQNSIYLNSVQQNFTWEHLAAADSYIFQLIRGDEFSNTIIEQATTANNFHLPTTTSLTEDLYTWKVKAVNSFSESSFVFRQFSFDTTSPNTPTLLSPASGSTNATTLDFTWNLGVDGGDIHAPITNVLEIATTNTFSTLFDQIEVTAETLNYTFSTTGTFYWRVRAYDDAGNTGSYSEVREIIIE